MKARALFATQIFSGQVEAELVAELEAACWMVEDGDAAGQRWSEEEGYDGYTSYASLNDLTRRATAFETLERRLDVLAAGCADALGWDLGAGRLALDSLWVNVLAPGGRHSGHIHPGSALSGTVYVDSPTGAGAIRFEDPRLAMMQAAPPLRDGADETLQRFVHVAPSPGLVLMWESWLRHEVMPNRAEAPRLSVSFNYAFA